ncbi:hypothetical protein SUGI_1134440 [Cryptomeria japonica]|uniref:uncharacterized protein LOC131859752 n=1 Tax=Cryptomeria japonica TaxID=3369 RepID=UPI0024149F60|nr:uncharacterized protein LOC131859752 [Cryptomeria japonica]GLJ53228.1 hypothetical protein SUGI_1134440 [Cryptomeria japonica]
MECSLCGDVGFQVYLFQCKKCVIRFQHQYCSKAYYENESVESISELCDWCFSTQEEDTGSDVKLMSRDSVKRIKSCSGFEECTNMTHNNKGKRNLKKSCAGIKGQIPNELKKQKNPELTNYSTERRVGKKYKLLDEIVC